MPGASPCCSPFCTLEGQHCAQASELQAKPTALLNTPYLSQYVQKASPLTRLLLRRLLTTSIGMARQTKALQKEGMLNFASGSRPGLEPRPAVTVATCILLALRNMTNVVPLVRTCTAASLPNLASRAFLDARTQVIACHRSSSTLLTSLLSFSSCLK